MYYGDPDTLTLGEMLPSRKNQKKFNYRVYMNGASNDDLMLQMEDKGSLTTVRLYLISSVTTVKDKTPTPRAKPVLSRKEVEEHIRFNTVYLDHLGLEVFTDYADPEKPVLRIEGKGGLIKTFTSTKAAKSWLTRENSKELSKRVNRDYATSQSLESKLDYIRYAY
jgi:hypothetical protein